MGAEIATEIVNQIMVVVAAVLASGWITNAVTELLKIKLFAGVAKKYPVISAVVTSLVVSAVSFIVLGLAEFTTWVSYVIYFAGTLAVATMSYDGIIKKFKAQNDAVDGDGTPPVL